MIVCEVADDVFLAKTSTFSSETVGEEVEDIELNVTVCEVAADCFFSKNSSLPPTLVNDEAEDDFTS